MKILRPLRRLLRVASRSVDEERGYTILPYRGYGSQNEVFLMGRVFYQPTSRPVERDSTGNLLLMIARRLLRRGVPDVEVEVRFAGSSERVSTDRYGYFRVHMDVAMPPSDSLWHEADVELVDVEDGAPEGAADASVDAHAAVKGDVFIPPKDARFVVISDIDDTVMYTGVANKIRMFWHLFASDAQSRAAFPGVAALYNALHDGPSGNEMNPILYVSRGPWGIYEMLDAFFNEHEIPIGPILFLREWNVRLTSPLPRRAEGHKKDLVRNMLSLYDALPFVLIGDSGQHDPEIYADIVQEHRDRVKAIYIRDVSGSSTRKGEIARLVDEIAKAGSSLMLADNTYAMARHAAEHGLISESALADVLRKRVEEADPEPQSGGPRRKTGSAVP